MINVNHTPEVSVTEASLLKRVAVFLEDGEFDRADEYCERVLDINVENGEAYFYKLLASLKLRSKDELTSLDSPIDALPAYAKIMRFGSEELKREVESINLAIAKNAEERKKALSYERAMSLINSSDMAELTEAYSLLRACGGFEDSAEKADYCSQRIENFYDSRYNELYLAAKEKEQEINDRQYQNSTAVMEKDDYDRYIKDNRGKRVFDYSLLVALGVAAFCIMAIFFSVSEYLSLAGVTFKTVLRVIFTKIIPGMPVTGISTVISFRISKKLVKKQKENLIEDIGTAAQRAKEISDRINSAETEAFTLQRELDERLEALRVLNAQYDAFVELKEKINS